MLLPCNLRAIGLLTFSVQGNKISLQKAKDTGAGWETVNWNYSKKDL